MPSVKSVLIVGEKFSDNLGDGVIFDCVKYLIIQQFPGTLILEADLSGKTKRKVNEIRILRKRMFPYDIYLNFKKYLYKFATIKRMRIIVNKQLRIYIKKACIQKVDFAVFAGGQIFREHFTIVLREYIKQLNKHSIPIIFNACGYSQYDKRSLRNILIRILSIRNIMSISLREDISIFKKEILLKVPYKRPDLYFTYDPALWASDTYALRSCKNSEQIGIGVIAANDPILYIAIQKCIKEIIENLIANKMQFELFCNGSCEDYEFALNIAADFVGTNVKVALRPLEPIRLIEIISRYKAVLACRLHSHIISSSLGIPSVALSWDGKIENYFRNIERSAYCFSAPFSSADVYEKLINCCENERFKGIVNQQKSCLKDILSTQITCAVGEVVK